MAKNKVIYGNTVLIDLTDSTVTASDLASGVTAYDRSGTKITGTSTYDADTSDGTAAASEILSSKTAYVVGNKLTGTMPNRGGVTGTISTIDGSYSIQSGYHDGSGVCEIDSVERAKLVPSVLKNGCVVLGVTGTYSGEAVPTQTKSATPYTTAQTILPDAGYDLSQVNVAAIAYTETANAYGTTVTIGTVAP